MSSFPATVFEGQWPVLEKITPYTDEVFEAIQNANNASVLSFNQGHFTLGDFYIHTSLLKPHKTQRALDNNHVEKLVRDFQDTGVFRVDYPGVVVGIGEGWQWMKHNSPIPYKITPTSPHLTELSGEAPEFIGEVIRGDHRTEAIKRYAEANNKPEESYWLYKVLIPGMLLIGFL